MAEFYTVSRKEIDGLSELDLFTGYSTELYNVQGLFSIEDAEKLLSSLYPNGISRHGKQYLCDKYEIGYNDEGRPFISYTEMIETIFELIRQLKFSEKPSRFTSVFGCLSYEDAITFKNTVAIGSGTIYQVRAESYFIADMNLLKLATFPANMFFAERYWRGESLNNPFWEVLLKPPVKIIKKIEQSSY